MLDRALDFAKPGGRLIALVKPQFEAERGEIGKGGVVRDPAVHERVCAEAADWVARRGWDGGGLVAEPDHRPRRQCRISARGAAVTGEFIALDWAIVGGYVLFWRSPDLSTRRQRDAEDYFLAGYRVPIWLVAISVLCTTQSAATFLGAPDYGYRGDYTYLTSYLGPLIAVFPVANSSSPVSMPRA